MRQIRKEGRTWRYRIDEGEWIDDYVEPNINILQPDFDGEGYVWPELELKQTKRKGKGVFATRDLQAGTEIPIVGDTTECSRTHSWETFDRARPENHKTECIDGHPSNDPYKGVANYGLSISMMLNEANNPNCTFRQSNYIQLVRNVKKGQELTVYYGSGREMRKIRKEQGYEITYEKTKDWPLESGTPAQRVANRTHWMGVIVLKKMENKILETKKDIPDYISDCKDFTITNNLMSRPTRVGSRNTFYCKFKNDKKNTCLSLPTATLYINKDLGIDEPHCLDCMKREVWTMNGAESISVGEWGKLMEQKSSSSSSSPSSSAAPKAKAKAKEPKEPKPKEPKPKEPKPKELSPDAPQASKKKIKKTQLVWNINDDAKNDDATLKWLKVNEVNLRKQFKDYPDVIDPLSHSLFTLAATRGKLKTMEYLLSLGADLNYVQTKTGDDALSAALYYNQYPAADLLIKKGMTLDIAKEIEKDPNRKQTEAIPPVERYQIYLRDVEAEEVKDEPEFEPEDGPEFEPEDEPEEKQTVGMKMMGSKPYWVEKDKEKDKDDDDEETDEEPVYPLPRNDSDSTDTTVVMSRNNSGVESTVLAELPEPPILSRHSSSDSSLGSLRYSPSPLLSDRRLPRSAALDINRVFPGLFGSPTPIKPLFGML